MLGVASVPGLGLSKGGEVPLYLVQAHGLVTAFLILMMLQYRGYLQKKRQRETQLALERSQMLVLQETKIREEQDKLMAMLAHELKTPLATMNMRLDADAQGGREIQLAIREMNAVIERCLQTAQLGDQQLQAQNAPVELVSLVRGAIHASAKPDQIQLESPSKWTVQTDHQLLFIVLNNLLENAIKYAAKDSTIQVKLVPATGPESEEFQARLEVNNLPGSAGWPEPRKLFQKYYRSPHARRQAGTGLGLYLVKHLVGVLGGRIDYSPDSSRIRFLIWIKKDPV